MDLVLSITSTLRRILGDEFDFIGFDPRGILQLVDLSLILLLISIIT